jgi:hypothetical protein
MSFDTNNGLNTEGLDPMRAAHLRKMFFLSHPGAGVAVSRQDDGEDATLTEYDQLIIRNVRVRAPVPSDSAITKSALAWIDAQDVQIAVGEQVLALAGLAQRVADEIRRLGNANQRRTFALESLAQAMGHAYAAMMAPGDPVPVDEVEGEAA